MGGLRALVVLLALLPGAAQARSFTLTLLHGPPDWLATRTDAGAWTVLPPGARFVRELGAAREVEWVVVCGRAVTHLRLRPAEHPGARLDCPNGAAPPQPATARLTVGPLDASPSRARELAYAFVGQREVMVGAQPTPVPTGNDLVVTRARLLPGYPERVIVRRGGLTADARLDFGSTEALVTTPGLLTVVGARVPLIGRRVQWHSCGGTVATLSGGPASVEPLGYARLPITATRACDRYTFAALALTTTEAGEQTLQYAQRSLQAPADVRLTLPGPPAPPQVGLESGRPFLRWATPGAAPALLQTVSFSNDALTWTATLSGTERGGYGPPDLSALPGWRAAWQPHGRLSWAYGVLGGPTDADTALRSFQGAWALGWDGSALPPPDGALLTYALVGGVLDAP